jgi:hypothetical protein
MILRSIAVLFVVLLPAVAMAAAPVSYVILKEGEPIGHETVAITTDGDLTTVEVQTETRVKVLFLDFHYSHRREEMWRSGQMLRMVADTDDDGSIHHIEFVHNDNGMVVTLDGVVKDMPSEAFPLSLWSKAILDRDTLFGVSDAAIYHVSIQSLGVASLVRNSQTVPTERYRISGDIDRDLWYGSDGLLVKTAFKRRGYPIEIIRE